MILNDKPQLTLEAFVNEYINPDIIENISDQFYDDSTFNVILDELANVKTKLEKLENQRGTRNIQQEQQKQQDEERYKLIISILNKLKDKEQKKISKYGGNHKVNKTRKLRRRN